jgi:hypothetical protein
MEVHKMPNVVKHAAQIVEPRDAIESAQANLAKAFQFDDYGEPQLTDDSPHTNEQWAVLISDAYIALSVLLETE